MRFRTRFSLLTAGVILPALVFAALPPKKPHLVTLGPVKQVPYSKAGDPAGAGPDETTLKIRPLLVDDRVSEWTTGESHDVTDRSFVVRRALRINDSLPSDPAADKAAEAKPADAKPAEVKSPPAPKAPAPQASHWVWQRGPWLLVDRVTGRATPLKLPDYDPGASQVGWFRDYAAYCGVTASGKSLYAVVAQVGARKPVLAKKLSAFDAENHPWPVCEPPAWQREPLHVTFHLVGRDPAGFDLAGGSAVLIEADDDAGTPAQAKQ
jgi:hypothetical protein